MRQTILPRLYSNTLLIDTLFVWQQVGAEKKDHLFDTSYLQSYKSTDYFLHWNECLRPYTLHKYYYVEYKLCNVIIKVGDCEIFVNVDRLANTNYIQRLW